MRQIHGAKEYFFLDEKECSKNIIKESEKRSSMDQDQTVTLQRCIIIKKRDYELPDGLVVGELN